MPHKLNSKRQFDTKAVMNAVSRNLQRLNKVTPLTVSAIEDHRFQLLEQHRILTEQKQKCQIKQQQVKQQYQGHLQSVSTAQANYETAKSAVKKQQKTLKTAKNNRRSAQSAIKKIKRRIKRNTHKLARLNRLNAKVNSVQKLEQRASRVRDLAQKAKKVSTNLKLTRLKRQREITIIKDELKILRDHESRYPGHCAEDITKLEGKLQHTTAELARLTAQQERIEVKQSRYEAQSSVLNTQLLNTKREFRAEGVTSSTAAEKSKLPQAKSAQEKLQNQLQQKLVKQQNNLNAAKMNEKAVNINLKACQRQCKKQRKHFQSTKKASKSSQKMLKNSTQTLTKLEKLTARVTRSIKKFALKLNSPKDYRSNISISQQCPSKQPGKDDIEPSSAPVLRR